MASTALAVPVEHFTHDSSCFHLLIPSEGKDQRNQPAELNARLQRATRGGTELLQVTQRSQTQQETAENQRPLLQKSLLPLPGR